MPSINELFRKVNNLEKYIKNHVENNSKTNKMNEAEFDAARDNTSKAQRSADQASELGYENSKNIEEVSDGLMETFEETVRNATSVEELQDAIMELYEMFIGKEM